MIIKKKKLTAQNTDEQSQVNQVPQQDVSAPKEVQPLQKEEKIDIFSLDNIDFSQRQERRRGDRRRGYRRIDDRNLISRAQEEADSIRETAAKEGYKAGLEQAEYEISLLRNFSR